MTFAIRAGQRHRTLVGNPGFKKMLEIIPDRAVGVGFTEVVDRRTSVERRPPRVVGSSKRHFAIDRLETRKALAVLVLIIPFIDYLIQRKAVVNLDADPMCVQAGLGRDKNGPVPST